MNLNPTIIGAIIGAIGTFITILVGRILFYQWERYLKRQKIRNAFLTEIDNIVEKTEEMNRRRKEKSDVWTTPMGRSENIRILLEEVPTPVFENSSELLYELSQEEARCIIELYTEVQMSRWFEAPDSYDEQGITTRFNVHKVRNKANIAIGEINTQRENDKPWGFSIELPSSKSLGR
ncbi:hypothetical protein Halru_2049 [Halovivax ruber XH-70]|uniref:Uncharacterized protein n=1 Tax=Halovivax ruber (strain DSM 18193 / JCM 13892 / XH-70) TaxID=797302 RepID=L0ICT2_HALRX|nr:hypothetical protein [Halovivax ruber]AGB16643.1 hypothetical protein Halru_2049 [Halovivax ruber XH-70]